MDKYLKIISDIYIKTLSGKLDWRGTSSDSCFNAQYNGRGIVICKYYPEDSEELISSLSYLDDDGMLTDKSYLWKEGEKEFEVLTKLYDHLAEIYKEHFE